MMHGALNPDGTLMEPTLPNYTMAIMVVQTDQTLRNIQDISLWNSVVMIGAGRSQLDWENGSIDIVQPQDVQMNGVYMPDAHNYYIDNLALKLLCSRLRLYRRFEHMNEADLNTASWQTAGNSY